MLLDTFSRLREENLNRLVALGLTDADLVRRGRHPELGVVTMGQHLATWVAHDLSHVGQTARVMARQTSGAVAGVLVDPWARLTGAVFEKTEAVLEKTETVLEKTETVLEKTEAVLEKTETVLEKTETVREKTETVGEKTGTVFKKTVTVLDNTGVVCKNTEAPTTAAGKIVNLLPTRPAFRDRGARRDRRPPTRVSSPPGRWPRPLGGHR